MFKTITRKKLRSQNLKSKTKKIKQAETIRISQRKLILTTRFLMIIAIQAVFQSSKPPTYRTENSQS